MRSFYKLKNICLFFPLVLLVLPSSTNYKLESFGFGPGEGEMNSTNYSLEGVLGETSNSQSSTNYKTNTGLIFMQSANTPAAPTFTNPSNYYNKLKIVIQTSSNPSDTLYAIAISTDNFVTTRWVQNDNTVGNTLGLEDYQTYTNWGGATGENIIGLTPGTTYKVKVKAMQPGFTESPLGPEVSAATVNSSIDMDIDVSATDTETSAPYSVSLGSLNIGSVNTSTEKIWIDFSTNAEGGGVVYIYDANAGLRSTSRNYTISSVTADLSGVQEGFGIRQNSATNLTFSSPYDGSSENVGQVDTTIRELLSSSNAPVSSGRASILIKAKPKNTTPASSDYSDVITLISAGTF